jgi:UDPglucose 6-dehydrogenase
LQIAVVGAGYVGLVAGSCFAETGHTVSMVEVDQSKIEKLEKGEVPFYEPGLKDLLLRNIENQRLKFGSDLKLAIKDAKLVFIAVGTPQDQDGSADLSYVINVATQIGQAMIGPLVVVNKSTVPVGTAQKVKETIQKETNHSISVVSNPEFLKEGTAVDDFLRPDRVVIGTEEEHARRLMADLYAPFVRTGNPIMFMDCPSAEMAKYTANGLLATRISFMNELARLCDAVGADIDHVRLGIGSDKRIGHSFLFAGPGYGGSCFPKDVRALIRTGELNDTDMELLRATDNANERQKMLLPLQVTERFGQDLSDLTIAIWGLAFKPKTDDIREAPALSVINDLLAHEATIRVYDPEAIETGEQVLGKKVIYCRDGYHCCEGADALVIVTEWNEFRHPDFDRIKELLKQPVIFDGRNLYDSDFMRKLGFEHMTLGRNCS